jgi:hypothetical protein
MKGKEIKLTKKENEAIEKVIVCAEACQQLVEKTVKHFETNKTVEHEWWMACEKKYKIDSREYNWFYDRRKKAIICTGTASNARLQKFDEDALLRRAIRESIRECFDLEIKK